MRRALLVAALSLPAAQGCLEDAVIARTRDAAATTDGPSPDAPDAAVPRLALRATLSGSATGNALAPDGFVTGFSFIMSLDGAPFEGATVRVRSAAGELALDPAGSGRYLGAQSGWHARYTVTVQRGATELWSRSLTALPAHRFLAPANESTVERDAPLAVAWAPGGASEAHLASPGPLRELIDNGMTALAPSTFPRDTTDEEMEIRVVRADTVTLDELQPGSFVRFEVSNSVDVHVAR